MQNLILLIVALVVIVLAVVAIPAAVIWSGNTLFNFGWEYTWQNLLAMFIVVAVFAPKNVKYRKDD